MAVALLLFPNTIAEGSKTQIMKTKPIALMLLTLTAALRLEAANPVEYVKICDFGSIASGLLWWRAVPSRRHLAPVATTI